MKFITTLNTIPSNTSMTRATVERVSRSIRESRDGISNYGIMINGGWLNVVFEEGDVKLHQGAYVYVSGSGMIARSEEIDAALSDIDSF